LLVGQRPSEQVWEVSHIAWAAAPFDSVNPQVQTVPLAERGVDRVGNPVVVVRPRSLKTTRNQPAHLHESRETRSKRCTHRFFSSLPGIGEGLESLKLTLVPSQATRAGITLARDERVELRRNRSRCELHNIVTAICCVIPRAGPQSAFANCRGKKSRLLHIARWAVRDELKSQSPAAFELRPQCPFGTFPPITP